MDFESFFKSELAGLHQEGRYRVFADLERQRGNFPKATRYNAADGEPAGRHRLVFERLSRHGPASQGDRGDEERH